MRRNKRHHTTSTPKTEVNRLRKGILTAIPALLIGLMFSLLASNPASASSLGTNEQIWELELYWGTDFDGDGFIGPPPRRDPPVGGVTMFDQIV